MSFLSFAWLNFTSNLTAFLFSTKRKRKRKRKENHSESLCSLPPLSIYAL